MTDEARDGRTMIRATRRRARTGILVAVNAAVLAAAMLFVVTGSPAGASGLRAPAATCTSYPVAECTTTTTHTVTSATAPVGSACAADTATPALAVSYSDGILSWRVTGLPASAAGTVVRLFIDGTLERSTTVGMDGCTGIISDPFCLAAGAHTVVAEAEPFSTLTETLQVNASGCPTASTGNLAFTGTNVLLLVAIALFLIALGYAMIRFRRRSHHHR